MNQPNILVFLTDDHGQWAAGCYGNSEIQSPTMDYLAKTGVKMTRAFTPTPVCSPARASFFTGRLASQHGIHDWIFETEEPGNQHPGLVNQTNIGHLLQNAGLPCGDYINSDQVHWVFDLSAKMNHLQHLLYQFLLKCLSER